VPSCCRHRSGTATSATADVVIALAGLLRVCILALEMLLWAKAAGGRACGPAQEFAATTKVRSARQGLHIGLLAAGWFGV